MRRRIICGLRVLLLSTALAVFAGGVVGGPAPEEALATAGGGGSPAATGPATTTTPKDAPDEAKPEEPQLEAKAWLVLDARTGEVLVSHAAGEKLPIASTTKLMTAWVALHEMPLGKIVHAAPYPDPEYGESLMGLRAGERISVRDLLYGLILRSGNDAAHALAVAAAGSDAKFVKQMNLRAAALGLSNTHYANPVGLDEKGNYSTARDLATLAQHLLRVPAFAKIADARSAVLHSVHPVRRISTINELLLLAPWVTGVKTGHTFKAGYVLVGSGRRKGVELISVVIGAENDETRFEGSLGLLERGFHQYKRRTPVRRGQDLADPSIRYSGGELPLRAARTIAAGIRPGQKVDVDVRAPGQVSGPLSRGQRIGTATVTVDGLSAGTVPLLAGRAIPAASAIDRIRAFPGENPIFTALALFVILIGGVLLWRAARRRGRTRGS